MADVNYNDIITKDIFDLMGAGDMPEDRKKELYTKILETLQNRVIARVADSLNDEDMKAWEEAKKTNDKAKMQEFLNTKGIDLNRLFLEEAIIYKVELTQMADPIRKAKEEFDKKK